MPLKASEVLSDLRLLNAAERNREMRMLKALQRSYSITRKSGSQSTERLFPLHGWLRDELQRLLKGPKWKITAQSPEDPREINVAGRYYGKNIDVGIEFEEEVVGVVNMKYVMSSYGKNAINYFEQQLGETANLRINNIIYGNILVVTNPIPVLRRDRTFVKWETFREQDLHRYMQLRSDRGSHTPDELAVVITEIKHSKEPQEKQKYQLGKVSGLVDLQTYWKNSIGHELSDDTRKNLERLTINEFINGLVLKLYTRVISP